MVIYDLLKASMRKIGVIASGENPTAEEAQDALESLQTMLRSIAAEKINIFASTSESVTLVSGTALYTWGIGGSINTQRPNQIIGAYVLDSGNVSHPVNVVSENIYRNLPVKNTSSRPNTLYPQFSYPYVTIYLYPVPDTAETLVLSSMKPFTETSSFSSIHDTLAMPPEYEEVLVYNLAVRIAPEYGKPITAEVAAIAASSYNRMTTRNAGNFAEQINIILPVRQSGRYSINSDSYR